MWILENAFTRAVLLIVLGLFVATPWTVLAQNPRVGEIDRIVESRKKKVKSTNQASIGRSAAMQSVVVQPPLRTGTALLTRDTLRLNSDIWMELEINRPGALGNAIVAKAGQYRIDSLDVANPLIFSFRQGRMSINLSSGRLGVLMKNKLTSIFGTEVLFESDSTADMHSIYLKQGHIAILEGGATVVDTTGKDLAWRWFGEAPLVSLAGAELVGLRDVMKFDTKTVWPRPIYQSPWFWVGAAAVIGGASCYAVKCGPFANENEFEVTVVFP
ncbi:MAG: hypothetical protein ACC655_04790 [Rhodothermia bacterium]